MVKLTLVLFAWYSMSSILTLILGEALTHRNWSSIVFFLFFCIPQSIVGAAFGFLSRQYKWEPTLIIWLAFAALSILERSVFRTFVIYEWDLVAVATLGGDIVLACGGFLLGTLIGKGK